MGRRATGRIPLPPVEIIEIIDGAPATDQPADLRERGGWLLRSLARVTGHDRSRFIVDPLSIPVEILRGRDDFPLLEIDEDGRPILRVVHGMSGEMRIGVSRMRVEDMLEDPWLDDPEFHGARLPLPFGARLRIECGPRTFVARVGGPPLIQTSVPATGSAIGSLARA